MAKLFLYLLFAMTGHSAEPVFEDGLIQLSQGPTYFKKLEAKAGNMYVVLVHGASLNCSMGSYNNYMRSLFAKGINSVCFDTYGTGQSASLEKEPSISIQYLDRQLEDFLDSFHGTKSQSVTLVGTSAGSCLSARYTTKHADRIKKIGFISPAIHIGEKFGLAYDVGVWLLKRFPQSEFIKDRVKKRLVSRTEKVISECPEKTQKFIMPVIKKHSMTTKYSDGFHRKILGNVFGDCREAFDKVVASEIPFFAVSGRFDQLADFELFQKTFKPHLTPSDFYKEYDAGHGLQCKHFDEISKNLIQFVGSPETDSRL